MTTVEGLGNLDAGSIPAAVLQIQQAMETAAREDTVDTANWEDLDYDLANESSDVAQTNVEIRILEFILQNIIIPIAVRRRDEDLAPKLGGSIEVVNGIASEEVQWNTIQGDPNASKPPSCISYDGEYAQNEATFSSETIRLTQENDIDLQKLPCGGSMQCQPNDKMRAHSYIHAYVHSSEYVDFMQNPCEDAIYIPTVERLMRENHIDAASRSCFLNFFRQLPTILSRAFTRNIIKSGWASTGLCPPYPQQMLANCTSLRDLSQTDMHNVLDALPELIEKARLNGILRDEEITEVIENLCEEGTEREQLRERLQTTITNMSSRCMNGQRALWYFKPEVTEKRRREEQQRRAVAEQRQMATLHRAVNESIGEVAAANPPIQQPYDPLVHECYRPCDNECPSFRSCVDSSEDDGWRMCCVADCNRWYCHKQMCQNRLTKHIQSCLRHKTMRETVTQIREIILNNSGGNETTATATALANITTGRGRGRSRGRGSGPEGSARNARVSSGGRGNGGGSHHSQDQPAQSGRQPATSTRSGGRGRGRARGGGGRGSTGNGGR